MRDWKEFLDNDLVRKEIPTRQEISSLIESARMSTNDPNINGLFLSNKFMILYSAARKWCDITLRAEGWRTCSTGHHEAVFSGFLEFLGEDFMAYAEFFDKYRRIRGDLEYIGNDHLISEIEVDELAERVIELQKIVLSWLKEKHPDLYPDV